MSSTLITNPWTVIFRPNKQARLRLFCFPYAGGAATIFRDWPRGLPSSVEVVAIQPPGRGTRLAEPAYNKLPPLVEALHQTLLPLLDLPFAFFGHSMGAVVGFELARALRRARAPEPIHLFVSGRRAPQIRWTEGHTFDLPEPQFLEELRQLNGTAETVLAHPELMQLMLPLLRADFEAIQTYDYRLEPPLDCSISAFGGIDDGGEQQHGYLEAWRQQTTARFSMQMFAGDHFFLQTCQTSLLHAISQELQRLVETQT